MCVYGFFFVVLFYSNVTEAKIEFHIVPWQLSLQMIENIWDLMHMSQCVRVYEGSLLTLLIEQTTKSIWYQKSVHFTLIVLFPMMYWSQDTENICQTISVKDDLFNFSGRGVSEHNFCTQVTWTMVPRHTLLYFYGLE